MPSARHVRSPNTRTRTIKHRTPLHIRRANQHEEDARLQAALAAARKAARAADCGPNKRRSNEFLGQYLALSLHDYQALRPESGYKARSYNRARQLLELINHVFVRYPVPLFLHRSVLTRAGLELVFDKFGYPEPCPTKVLPEFKYRQWFLAVAQGASFAKASKDVFTKREAHWFLKAPNGNTIDENILWARAAAAGLPAAGCDYLVERLTSADLRRMGERLPDLLRIFSESWAVMRPWDRDELMDYLREVIRDRSYSLKGRTFGSLRKLSTEWHRTTYTGRVGEYRSWSTTFQPWEMRKKGLVVRAFELTNNRALVEEGQRQRHCVYSYTGSCVDRTNSIVSMRWYVGPSLEKPTLELERLTIQVMRARNAVVQIRGKLNRAPTDEEMVVVRHWAGVHGLTIDRWSW